MQESRLFRIIYYLIENGKCTALELAEKFEVSVRTIYRDVDVISSAGVPIYVTTGRNGGIQIADDFVIDRMLLSEKEKEDIIVALKSISVVDNQNKGTLSKISAIFNMKSESWLEVDFSRWGSESNDNIKFNILKKAILSQEKLSIVYANSSGEVTERTICPLKIVYKASDWYVKAYCINKADFRIFKITRIIKIKETGNSFAPLKFPQEEKEQPKNEYEHIILHFSKSLAYRIYDEFDIDNIKQDANGDFIVSVSMPVDHWLLGYILSFGSKVRIIEPEYLKEAVGYEAQKIWEHYKP